jgi:hypothetical protein
MKAMAACLGFLVIALATLPGCGGGAKKSEETGPRITGGAPVDKDSKPQRPSLGGTAKPE